MVRDEKEKSSSSEGEMSAAKSVAVVAQLCQVVLWHCECGADAQYDQVMPR